MKIKLLVEGGDLKPGPVLSQKLGPLGIPMGNVIQKVNETTKNFKGMKVPVELDIDPSTKDFIVNVSSPPVSELLKKELGIEKGSGEQGKVKSANASIEQIISVAKTKLPDMLSRDLKAAVKTVVGSAVSLGILIENKNPKDIEKEIDEGMYDSEISQEKTETSEEKLKELNDYFSEIRSKQEKALEVEKKEAAAVAEAKKAKDEKTLTEVKKAKEEEEDKKK